MDWLKREGFSIGAPTNPTGTRDEVILACDVVTRSGWDGLDADNPRVAELSHTLQLVAAYSEELSVSTYATARVLHERPLTSPPTSRT